MSTREDEAEGLRAQVQLKLHAKPEEREVAGGVKRALNALAEDPDLVLSTFISGGSPPPV